MDADGSSSACIDWMYTYLSDEALEGGELVHGGGHLAHVVGDVGGAAERVGDDGVGERLVERVQALAQRLLRLQRRLLQPVHAHDLLLRQGLHVAQQHLHACVLNVKTSSKVSKYNT